MVQLPARWGTEVGLSSFKMHPYYTKEVGVGTHRVKRQQCQHSFQQPGPGTAPHGQEAVSALQLENGRLRSNSINMGPQLPCPSVAPLWLQAVPIPQQGAEKTGTGSRCLAPGWVQRAAPNQNITSTLVTLYAIQCKCMSASYHTAP